MSHYNSARTIREQSVTGGSHQLSLDDYFRLDETNGEEIGSLQQAAWRIHSRLELIEVYDVDQKPLYSSVSPLYVCLFLHLVAAQWL